jgi:CMP/dCMP kinase
MAVITLSREFASGGDEVASRLCEVLGYHSFGKQQIIQAATDTTLSKNNIIDYSEDNHEIQAVKGLFGHTASSVQKIAWSENPSIAKSPEQADVHEAAVLGLTKRAILAAGRAGNMVIIGRGGQILLKNTPGVLHVRIEAPVEMRVAWVKQQLSKEQGASQTEEKISQTASDIIATREMASADYIKRYFNADWRDPRLYDMVLNMGKFNIEQAVKIILSALDSLGMRPTISKE